MPNVLVGIGVEEVGVKDRNISNILSAWLIAGYFTVILSFLAFRFCSAYFIYLVSCKWYQSTFLGRNCG
jgi:hypothetical protein